MKKLDEFFSDLMAKENKPVLSDKTIEITGNIAPAENKPGIDIVVTKKTVEEPKEKDETLVMVLKAATINGLIKHTLFGILENKDEGLKEKLTSYVEMLENVIKEL